MPDARTALDGLAAEWWDFTMRTSPVWATQIGDRRFDRELPRIDERARDEQQHERRQLRARLDDIDRAALDDASRVTADALAFELDSAIEEQEFRLHERDVNQLFGSHVWVFELANWHAPDPDGLVSLLARLSEFPRYVADQIDNLRAGLAEDNVVPRVVAQRVEDQLDRLLAQTTAGSPLLGFLDRLPESTPASLRERGREALLAAHEELLRPALEDLRDFLSQDYLPRTPEEVGIGRDDFGRRAYRHMVWAHTSLRLSPETLHNVGLELLTALREQMTEIAVRAGHQDLATFHAALRADPSAGYSSREELLGDAERLLEEAKALLPGLFGRLPRAECVVRPIEAYREADAPAAYYQGPAVDGSRPGIFYVNTYQPETRVRQNLPALTVHEAVPGHHLQIALARETRDLPEFRRHSGATAYVEGWALYTETLADEVGFYRDDLARFGMLTFQAWRAARLVVDTGMHALGWDRERALRFARTHVAISEGELENEIDRYVLWPGQALAYMVGRREIASLRRRAEAALGPGFSLKGFHDEVLRNGAVPLSVLGGVVDRWISRCGSPIANA